MYLYEKNKIDIAIPCLTNIILVWRYPYLIYNITARAQKNEYLLNTQKSTIIVKAAETKKTASILPPKVFIIEFNRI